MGTEGASISVLRTERDVFYVRLGGFDHHNEVLEALSTRFGQVDAALAAFVTEMKAQRVWDSVVVQETSEFGRTLASNGRGTDHAWGGNQIVYGGAVNGTRILGEFPSHLGESADNPVSIGGGRILPTTSWESIWAPVAEWMGVGAEDLDSASAIVSISGLAVAVALAATLAVGTVLV